MDKFSKLKNKEEVKEKKDKVLYSDEHIKLVSYEDWSILKSRDCVMCIPYLIETNEIVLRQEYIPTFKYVDGQEYHITIVAGGIELGETPDVALLRELEEEAGIVLKEDFKLEMSKPLFLTKGSTCKMHPYIIPLTEGDYKEIVAKGDGTKAESLSRAFKIDAKRIDQINCSDLPTQYLLMLIKDYLRATY